MGSDELAVNLFRISQINQKLIRDNIKGEIVIVVEGNKNVNDEITNYEEIFKELIEEGYTKSDAIKFIASKYNVRKNELYSKFK